VLHQFLLAQNPPILFHTLKQSAGEFVITFSSAFHFMMNLVSNFTEAVNFCAKKWEFYMNKTANFIRDLKEKFNATEKQFMK
jgi:hypothetical protein